MEIWHVTTFFDGPYLSAMHITNSNISLIWLKKYNCHSISCEKCGNVLCYHLFWWPIPIHITNNKNSLMWLKNAIAIELLVKRTEMWHVTWWPPFLMAISLSTSPTAKIHWYSQKNWKQIEFHCVSPKPEKINPAVILNNLNLDPKMTRNCRNLMS